jgi:hypothetical protein
VRLLYTTMLFQMQPISCRQEASPFTNTTSSGIHHLQSRVQQRSELRRQHVAHATYGIAAPVQQQNNREPLSGKIGQAGSAHLAILPSR